MTEQEIKAKMNFNTRRSCLSDAKVVYVRHCCEKVPYEGRPWGGVCHLIHPDVSLNDFFK